MKQWLNLLRSFDGHTQFGLGVLHVAILGPLFMVVFVPLFGSFGGPGIAALGPVFYAFFASLAALLAVAVFLLAAKVPWAALGIFALCAVPFLLSLLCLPVS